LDLNPPGFDIFDVAWRLGAAVLVGMIIGLNRDLSNKPIGMRTLGLVSLGAAIVAVSTVHYGNLAEHPDALSRVVQGVIQGVMAGIGFIGAGVILRDTKEKTVKGLTTAATVWVTAALGIACGLASWQIVALSMVLAVFLLVGVAWIEAAFEKTDEGGYK
jgi:putative Mg2+ transporter-C (MgtC) family protein